MSVSTVMKRYPAGCSWPARWARPLGRNADTPSSSMDRHTRRPAYPAGTRGPGLDTRTYEYNTETEPQRLLKQIDTV